VTILQEQKGLEAFGGEVKRFQNLLRWFGLKPAEFELRMGVMVDREIDPGGAPIADPVEDNDSLISSPLV
jgi:hypothetical protein